MRRHLMASLIAASLALTACAAGTGSVEQSPEQVPAAAAPDRAADPTATGTDSEPTGADRLDAADQAEPTGATAVAPVRPGPDPSKIRVVPQPVDAPGPVRAQISGLGTIPVQPVGVTDDQEAEIPEDISRVGWYKFGSAPGDRDGSVVLMGHRDGANARGALFELAGVPVGSTITVTDAAGKRHNYRVEQVKSISKQVVPLADLFQRDGPRKLIVISCGGAYIKEQGGYLDNVVLTAVPV